MEPYLILLLAFILILVVINLITPPECKHEDQVYYDASGDELPGDQSDACFCKCVKCGRVGVIPSGFQSDAHFDNYLSQSELGGSKAVKKIRKD